ncbi:MAG: DUF4180 domain-containing protein [Bauldia sp.]
MPDRVHELGGVRVLEIDAAGPPFVTRREVTDLVSAVWSAGADMVALPVARQGAPFFDLKTRVAGELMQMLTNYSIRLAFVGAMPAEVADSTALRDFIYESNKGKSVWFVADMAELGTRLGAA